MEVFELIAAATLVHVDEDSIGEAVPGSKKIQVAVPYHWIDGERHLVPPVCWGAHGVAQEGGVVQLVTSVVLLGWEESGRDLGIFHRG